MIQRHILSNFRQKFHFFYPLHRGCNLPVSHVPSNDNSTPSLLAWKSLEPSGCGCEKMNPAALHKKTTRTNDLWQFFWKMNPPESSIKKTDAREIRKFGKERKSEISNSFVTIKTTSFFFDCCQQKHFCLDELFIVDQSTSLYAQFVKKEAGKKSVQNIFQLDTYNIIPKTKVSKSCAALSLYKTSTPCE